MVRPRPSARVCEVGLAIRGYQRASGLTQQQLAHVAGVSLGLVRDLEQGRTRSPRWRAVEVLANALGWDERDCAKLVAAWKLEGPRQADRGQPDPAQPVNVRILGPLAAERSGRLVGLGSERRRTVLAVLALRGQAGARRNELIDMFWPGDAPSGAAGIIQGHVSQLRRLLNWHNPESYQPIVWRDGSYRLNSGPLCRLDSNKFVSLARCGDGPVAEGAPDRACVLYERALLLWRDAVVADIDCLRQHPMVVELDRQRPEVALQYADAGRQCRGSWRGPAVYEGKACRDEPLSEVLHARLIAALGDLGRRSEAVRVFERLSTELRIGPSELVWRAYTQAVGL